MTTEQALAESAARQAEYARQAALIRPNDAITPERLLAVGFATDDEKAAGEFVVRIVGGDDRGEKRDSHDDKPDDEIAELILSPYYHAEKAGRWGCFVETYHASTLNVVDNVEIGDRATMGEVLDLCRALKAWAVRYPAA